MGIVLSYIPGYSSDDTVDSQTGLTKREKRLVKETWNIIRADSVASGVAIMTSYFKKYPQYQRVFPAFKDIPLDELASNKKFHAHCLNIMGTLNSALDSMDDVGLLEAVMVTAGERHGRRGQGRREFTDLKEVMLKVLEHALGSKFTPEVLAAWEKTIDLLFSKMYQGMDNVRNHE